ncbi:MAG TPA: glycosyltransferase, partial [Vicinamibacteria bacterium]
MARTILIAAGGTGGHLFPGIAVADELKARDPETRVVFVGTPRGL